MRRTALCLLFWLCSCAGIAAQPAHYSVTDVGPCSDASVVINDHGQVAGSFPGGRIINAGNHGLRGFLWMHGKRTDLRLLPGYTSTIVCAINNHGQVAGNLDDTTDGAVLVITSHAFRWEHGKLRDLGAPNGDAVSTAQGMNDAGEIVGVASVSGRPISDDPSQTEPHAFVYRGGSMVDLGVGEANAINARGQIVGETPGAVYLDATLWDHGKVIKLGIHGIAQAINNKGQILIEHTTAQPVLWQQGRSYPLPLPFAHASAQAAGINDRRQVIGTANNGQNSRALLWQDKQVFDLNTLISPHSGWVLTDATGINNQGQIVGHGLFHGKERAFLLTPKP